MYTAAELFNLATKADAKEVFLSNVTMSIPDDLPGCANLDAEKDRLSKIWEVAHMSINEMIAFRRDAYSMEEMLRKIAKCNAAITPDKILDSVPYKLEDGVLKAITIGIKAS